MNKKLLIILLLVGVSLSLILLTVYLITTKQSIFSRAASAPSCPSGTQYLFVSSTSLRVGGNTALGGKIESISGNPTMENRDGIPLVQNVIAMKVKFPNQVILDTALIFDNDPKSGEKPWSINGQSLPVSGSSQWGPPFKLNQTADVMNFDNGGDSPHINVCVKETSQPTSTPIPTKTPSPPLSPTPTKIPSPSLTPTLKLTPTVTPHLTTTPSPSICPKPNAVTNIKVTCEGCQLVN